MRRTLLSRMAKRGGIWLAASLTSMTLVACGGGSGGDKSETAPELTVWAGTPVVLAGIEWMPMGRATKWADANALCSTATLAGKTAWRLPNQWELSFLYESNLPAISGLRLGTTWSSTAYRSDKQYAFDLNTGAAYPAYSEETHSVMCVKEMTPVSAGSVMSQAGLTWVPATIARNWTNAGNYCLSLTANDETGWHLPNRWELAFLYETKAMNIPGWLLGGTWTADPYLEGQYYRFDLKTGAIRAANPSEINYAACVKQSEPARTGAAVSAGGLVWMPATVARNWADANTLCASITYNGMSGWRLPLRTELSAMYGANAMNVPGWQVGGTWTSESYLSDQYYRFDLNTGAVRASDRSEINYVACVHA